MLEGVEFEFTTFYTPEQNSISEYLNHTITESIQVMLLNTYLSLKFWGEAVKTVCYLQNWLPLGQNHEAKTLYKLHKGFKPIVNHLWMFRCIVHCHILKKKWAKLKNTLKRGIFIGYCKDNHQFHVWSQEREEVEIHTHVLFLEKEKGGDLLKDQGLMDSFMNKSDNDTSAPLPHIPLPVQRCSGSKGASERASNKGVIGGGNFKNQAPEFWAPEFWAPEFENSNNVSNNNNMDSGSTEDNEESSSEAENLLKSIVESLKQQASGEYITQSEQTVIPNQKYTNEAYFANITVQGVIQKPATYKKALRSSDH